MRAKSEADAKAPAADAPASSEPESVPVVLATFPNRHAAERMVSSLGHGFRGDARKGSCAAFVITLNRDGSFKLVESRVISASGVVAAGIRIPIAVMMGFMGLRSTFKGVKSGVGAARARTGHGDAGADRIRELLSRCGTSGAVLLIRTTDQATAQTVDARAGERATDHWRGSSGDLIAALDRLGSAYDWLRPAAGEPPAKKS